MIWNIQLKLERPDEFKKDDESWFDKEHIESEIITWLEDLDYKIKKINHIIERRTFQKMKTILISLVLQK